MLDFHPSLSHNAPGCQAYQFVEIFAGQAWVSRVMRSSGKSTASLDIIFGDPLPGKQNVMDLTTPSGFWFPGQVVSTACFEISPCNSWIIKM